MEDVKMSSPFLLLVPVGTRPKQNILSLRCLPRPQTQFWHARFCAPIALWCPSASQGFLPLEEKLSSDICTAATCALCSVLPQNLVLFS